MMTVVVNMALTHHLLLVLLLLAASSLLAAAPTAAEESSTDVQQPSSNTSTNAPPIEQEVPCSRAGGMCLPANECPTGRLSQTKGLCPSQKSAGIECCHGLSVNEKRCAKRGGSCMLKTRCGRALWDENAKDCSHNEACCILVEK